MQLHDFPVPLVAILRGLAPADAAAVGAILFEAGFRLLEVPLNRPGALDSIAILAEGAQRYGAAAMVGGGTMLSTLHVNQVAAAGGRLMVAPNCDPQVIRHALALGMLCAPGVATPSEAFHALAAGAHALKIFPAEMLGPRGLKAMQTVLPPQTPLWPVGGITPDTLASWRAAGATGAGIGSALYQPGIAMDELARRARAYVAAWTEGA